MIKYWTNQIRGRPSCWGWTRSSPCWSLAWCPSAPGACLWREMWTLWPRSPQFCGSVIWGRWTNKQTTNKQTNLFVGEDATTVLGLVKYTGVFDPYCVRLPHLEVSQGLLLDGSWEENIRRYCSLVRHPTPHNSILASSLKMRTCFQSCSSGLFITIIIITVITIIIINVIIIMYSRVCCEPFWHWRPPGPLAVSPNEGQPLTQTPEIVNLDRKNNLCELPRVALIKIL